jgi:ABC-type sugar transport system ATPase subunit
MLEVRGLQKFYVGNAALRWGEEDSVQFLAGEVHALAGENGAGKSTLMKIISGIERPSSGTMSLGGHPFQVESIAAARELGLEIVLQESGLIPTMTVAENLFLGREQEFSSLGILNRSRMREASQEALNRVNSQVDPNAVVESLDLETQKFIELARALAHKPRVLIIDEMTASLSLRGVAELKRIMGACASGGATVLFISHYLEEVFELCDQVTVLRDGQLVATTRTAETSEEELQILMVGRSLIGSLYHNEDRLSPRSKVVLSVDNLTVADKVQNCTFSVREGEILGIGGLVGCGAQDIAMAIYGMASLSGGSVKIKGKSFVPTGPRTAIEAGLAYVTGDRERNDLLLQIPIQDNVVLPSLPWRSRFGLLSRRSDRFAVGRLIEKLQIACQSSSDLPMNLSGGNRQKVVLARWLVRDYPVLVLHNPTRGVDVGAKSEIYALLRSLAAEGAGILLISDELNELIGMSDRVLMMRKGKFTGEFTHESAMTEEALIECMV